MAKLRRVSTFLPLIALLATACSLDVPDLSAFPDALDTAGDDADAGLDAATDDVPGPADADAQNDLAIGSDAELGSDADATAPDTDAAIEIGADATDGDDAETPDADAATTDVASDADAAADSADAVADSADAVADSAADADAATDATSDAGPCPVGCDDGVTCTTDTCDPGAGCVHTPVNSACDDANVCTDDVCGLADGCTHTANTASCDDNSACTSGDKCANAACAGSAISCDDSNPCTTDSCAIADGCHHVAWTSVECSDSNLCTTDACNPASGCENLPIDPTTCDDGKVCTTDSCVAETGCAHGGNTLPCDDGNACTAGDICAAESCTSGGTVNCDDGKLCTDDSCNGLTGCVNTANSLSCDDNDPCTLGDTCGSSDCQPGATPKDCNDTNACTTDTCEKGVGCQNTLFDLTQCDDKNACTADSCQPLTGCVHVATNEGQTCTSSDACAVLNKCTAGVCGGSPKLFSTSFGAPEAQGANAVVALANGSFAVAGNTATDQNNATTYDGVVYLRDAAGQAIWTKTFGAAGVDDRINALIEVGGKLVFAGYTTDSLGQQDGWIGFVDEATGNASIVKIGGTGGDAFSSIEGTSDGGFLLSGSTSSPEYDASPGGWLVRTDGAGKVIWSKVYHEVGDVGFTHATSDATGVYATGTIGWNFNVDVWVVHTDLAGKLLWNKRIDTDGWESGKRVMVRDGSVEVAASTNGKGTNYDFWLVSLDKNDGSLLWDKYYGGGYFNTAIPVSDGYVLGGWGYINYELIRTDLKGDVVWRYDGNPLGSNSMANALAATSDGVLVAGHVDGTKPVIVVRFDAFGNLTCADSGACASKTFSDCVDANSCTFDKCDATNNGCFHPTATDAMFCDDGQDCTLNEKCSGGSCSAAQPKLFATTFGGALADSGTAIDVLSDGRILVGASTYSKTAGNADAWILLRTSTGAAVWDKSFGGAGNDKVTGVLGNAGNGDSVMFVGETTTNATGDSDAWYGQLLTASGDPNNGGVKTFGGNGADAFNAVARMPDRGVILAGKTSSTDLGAYGTDGLLVKMSAFGDVQWSKVVNETLDEYFLGVGADASGIYAVGRIDASNSANLWVVRFDSSGNKLWSRVIDAGGYDVGITAMPVSNGVAVAGATDGKGAGSNDFWLLRFAANGDKLWDRTYGNGGIDALQGAVATTDGFVMHGWNYGNSQTIRTDLSGDVRWFKSYNPTGVSSIGVAIAAAGDGFVTAGHTEGSTGFDSQEVLVNRLDRFGNTTCAASGGCLGTASSTCDDGNTCTFDLCDASGGCTHTNLADKGLCDDGVFCTMNEFCTNGTCGGGITTDSDGDGFPAIVCGGSDCNDYVATTNIAAPDYCDDGTVDDNCDGLTDNVCTCATSYWPVISDGGHICAPDAPVWGYRQEKTDGLFKDNGDGTATDSQTRLMWHIASVSGNFNAVTAACLASTLGGYSDWRLPSMSELSTLIDITQTPIPTASVFANSTEIAAYASGWGSNDYNKNVYFQGAGGYGGDGGDGSTTAARCVRGGPPVKKGARFTLQTDTAYDTFTGITWQRAPDLTTQFSYAGAVAHCASVTTDGATWRLPTWHEWIGIVHFGSGGQEWNDAFPNSLGNGAWGYSIPAQNPNAVMSMLAAYALGGAWDTTGTATGLAVCVH
jgi:hypothetical protein